MLLEFDLAHVCRIVLLRQQVAPRQGHHVGAAVRLAFFKKRLIWKRFHVFSVSKITEGEEVGVLRPLPVRHVREHLHELGEGLQERFRHLLVAPVAMWFV